MDEFKFEGDSPFVETGAGTYDVRRLAAFVGEAVLEWRARGGSPAAPGARLIPDALDPGMWHAAVGVQGGRCEQCGRADQEVIVTTFHISELLAE